jgi:hypothetical protein
VAAPILRAATREDIAELAARFGVNPTMRAIVADLDGRLIGIGGVFRHHGRWYAFCSLTDEARAHKMTILRGGKRLVAMMGEMGLRFVYAHPDDTEPRSAAWLMSLGFQPTGNHFWRWSA